MTVLNITNLTKRFGKFKALDGIDLKLQPGEIFGFIGPNGAGKSTTLQIILGVLTPSSGNIEIFGKDALTEVVTIHEHLAFVPGDVNLWPNLTGGEVIDFFLKLKNIDENDRNHNFVSEANRVDDAIIFKLQELQMKI